MQQSQLSHPQCLLPRATVPSGHPQHLRRDSFDCCIDRYDIVVYCPKDLVLYCTRGRDFGAFQIEVSNEGLACKNLS